jgi:hypothetical protein
MPPAAPRSLLAGGDANGIRAQLNVLPPPSV